MFGEKNYAEGMVFSCLSMIGYSVLVVRQLRSRFSCVEAAAVRKLRFACMSVKHCMTAPPPLFAVLD